MEIKVEINGNETTRICENNESSFWEKIGEFLLDISVPGSLKFHSDAGNGCLSTKARGTFIKDGIKYPSMFTTESSGTSFPSLGDYKPRFLVCVNAEGNNYKFYRLEVIGDELVCHYGSLDEYDRDGGRVVKYPTHLYWVRYYEKLTKGYKDLSDIYLASATATKKPARQSQKTPSKTASERLFTELMEAAKGLAKTYLAGTVTPRRVAKARQLYKKLAEAKRLATFNKRLAELMAVSPRKRDPLSDHVCDFMARSTTDFPKILNFEDDLIMAMEAIVEVQKGKNESVCGSFGNGIEVFDATPEQEKEVRGILGTSSLASMVKHVYRVKPLAQEKKFRNYCQKHGVKVIKKFWHGSKTENWCSIISNSLQLHPNAELTGSMFGKGLYFAPSAHKSFGYTSYRGSSWAHGRDTKGFMGIYATAYGNPKMVSTWGGDYASEIQNSDQYDCVHATAQNTGLRADEVVFYDEDAVCLNYIVEFAD